MGSMNFIMQTNPDMLANYPEAEQSLIVSRPLWATIAFAIAVFGGVIGGVLILLKKGAAYYVFVASFLGVLITNIHTFLVSTAIPIWVGSLMSLIVAAFLIKYSQWARRKGWIK